MKKENFENALTEVNSTYIAEAAEPAEKKKRGVAWKVLPAAVIAACFVLTVNAAVPVNLGFYLSAAFGDGYEVIGEMVSMPNHVAYRSSGDEMSLELKGIVGDGHVVKVFVDLTVSADTEIPEGLGKTAEFALFDLKLSPTGMPWEKQPGSYGTSTGCLAVTENDDGSTTFSNVLTMRSRDELIGGKYIISCTKMSYWDADVREEKNVLEGKWNLGFSLDYLDISEKIPVEVSGNILTAEERLENDELVCDYAEAPVEIYEVNLSPLSISVFWKAENEYQEVFEGRDIDVNITMTDGSEIIWKDYWESEETGKFRLTDDGRWYTVDNSEPDPIYITGKNSGGGCAGHGEPYMGHIILTFDAPLDTENVMSVTIGGVEVIITRDIE